jgi:hypothetical protein
MGIRSEVLNRVIFSAKNEISFLARCFFEEKTLKKIIVKKTLRD